MSNDTVMRKRKRKLLAVKLIAAAFIALLLMRVDFSALFSQHHNVHDIYNVLDEVESGGKKNILRDIMVQQHKQQEVPFTCDIPFLKNHVRPLVDEATSCVRSRPIPSSCKLVKTLFGDPSTNQAGEACQLQPSRDFCLISGSPSAFKPSCDKSKCDNGQLYLGTVAIETGKTSWTKYTTDRDLELAIQKVIGQENAGYCYIECANAEDFAGDDYMQNVQWNDLEDNLAYPQILNLPPYVENQRDSNKNDNFINFNFIFIDSVSRHHFFRSLPKSVKVLENFGTGSDSRSSNSRNPIVLDYELVQGVRSRTFETLETLFTGSINPFEKPFGIHAMPKSVLKTEILLKPLQTLGYKTLHLEDLCPFWEWGMSKDLLVYNTKLSREQIWRKMHRALHNASIDSMGNTYSSCKILNANNVPDPFHGPDYICYNAHHQHDYLFDYLKLYQRTMTHESQPYFTFLETNVGHDATGKRIQNLDTALSEYLLFAKEQSNTLTMIFSDHGNSYGSYTSRSNEGRLELFHPFLFMIVPEEVSKFLGDEQIHSLMTNQLRLVSILDLHYTLTSIVKQIAKQKDQSVQKPSTVQTFKSTFPNFGEVSEFNKQFNVTEFGLLTDISDSRTCSQMPRIMPNLCICDGFEQTVLNYDYHYILALHTVGEVNNQILKQKNKGDNTIYSGFGRCKPMKVESIKNLKESEGQTKTKTLKMDLYVKPRETHKNQSKGTKQGQEIFFITVHVKDEDQFYLGNFERITPYGKFSECADRGVNLQLCICDLPTNRNRNSSKTSDPHKNKPMTTMKKVVLKNLLYKDLKSEIINATVNGEDCLYIVKQSNKAGIIFEAVNLCEVSLKVTMTLTTTHMELSSKDGTFTSLVPAGVNVYLGSAVASDITVLTYSMKLSLESLRF